MDPTDKRIATVEQWQALKGVIDGNIGKTRELTAADYNYPTDNPTSVALWLLEPGVYGIPQSTLAYITTTVQAAPGFAIVSPTSGGYKRILHSGANSPELYVWTVTAAGGTLSTPNSITLTRVVDNLTTTSSTSPLSAAQGKALKDLIDAIVVPTSTSQLTNDSAFQTSTQVASAVAAEATARETADAGLQSQIDAIVSSSDVTDIVGTKAELDGYDTAALNNNDIVKVLQDESEDEATTYYRYNAATQQFTLIGEEGPYYTKSQADSLLNTKQDSLTAGSNIQITGNTISATNTTYTAGDGLSLSGTEFSVDTGTIATQADLTTGLATKQNTLTPGENITIEGDTISASGGQSTLYDAPGGNTDGAMTQLAATSMIFPRPDLLSGARIKIGQTITDNSASSYNILIGNEFTLPRGNGGNVIVTPQENYRDNFGHHVVAVGLDALSLGNGSIALGAFSKATSQGEFNIGTSVAAYGHNGTNYRLLTGVHNGENDHDAVTVGQLNAAIAGISGAAEIDSEDWSSLWP